MCWLWAAFPWQVPGHKVEALLLRGHDHYSTAVIQHCRDTALPCDNTAVFCGLWVLSPCVGLISFPVQHISSLMEQREDFKI